MPIPIVLLHLKLKSFYVTQLLRRKLVQYLGNAEDRHTVTYVLGMWRSRWMRISCAKSVRLRYGFVVQSKLPAIIVTVIQLSYLKLSSCKQTSSEQLK